jgi:hypothetical protein
MTAPIGAPVRMFMDVDAPGAPAPRPDDWIVSVSSGRCWVVVAARPTTRGPNAGRRWRLACLVQRGRPPPDAPRWRMRWYRRRPRTRG